MALKLKKIITYMSIDPLFNNGKIYESIEDAKDDYIKWQVKEYLKLYTEPIEEAIESIVSWDECRQEFIDILKSDVEVEDV